MVVRKITISLEESAYEAAVAAAKAAGLSLSAWLSRYAEHRARVEEGLRAVAAYEAEYGRPASLDPSLDPGPVLDDLGVGAPVPPARNAEFATALARLRERAA
jgi:hypothetical protein